MPSSSDRVVRVISLAGDIVLCSWARHLTLTVPLKSPPGCINGYKEINAGGNPAMDFHPIQGGEELLLVASCYKHRDKLRPDGPLGSYADFLYLFY